MFCHSLKLPAAFAESLKDFCTAAILDRPAAEISLAVRVEDGSPGFTCSGDSAGGNGALMVVSVVAGGAAEAAGVLVGMHCRKFQGADTCTWSWETLQATAKRDSRTWVFLFASPAAAPDVCIVYRDGLSESQLDEAETTEVEAVRAALAGCAKRRGVGVDGLRGAMPSLVFAALNKSPGER